MKFIRIKKGKGKDNSREIEQYICKKEECIKE